MYWCVWQNGSRKNAFISGRLALINVCLLMLWSSLKKVFVVWKPYLHLGQLLLFFSKLFLKYCTCLEVSIAWSDLVTRPATLYPLISFEIQVASNRHTAFPENRWSSSSSWRGESSRDVRMSRWVDCFRDPWSTWHILFKIARVRQVRLNHLSSVTIHVGFTGQILRYSK